MVLMQKRHLKVEFKPNLLGTWDENWHHKFDTGAKGDEVVTGYFGGLLEEEIIDVIDLILVEVKAVVVDIWFEPSWEGFSTMFFALSPLNFWSFLNTIAVSSPKPYSLKFGAQKVQHLVQKSWVRGSVLRLINIGNEISLLDLVFSCYQACVVLYSINVIWVSFLSLICLGI